MDFNNNKYTFRVFLFFLIFLFGKDTIGQTPIVDLISKSDSISTIRGKISDKDTGEEMIAANIQVFKNGNFVQGETTDIDGNYTIQVDSGGYDMEVTYTGYPTQKITGIIVNEGRVTKVDVLLTVSLGNVYFDVVVCSGCCRIPLIQHDKTTTGAILSRREDKDFFKKLPSRNINEMILMTPGVTFGN